MTGTDGFETDDASFNDASFDDASFIDPAFTDRPVVDPGVTDAASMVEPRSTNDGSMLPYTDLVAPTPLRADPPVAARWLAFGSILLGGLLGALIGYGVLDLFTGSANWSALGALFFGVGGAVGLGIVTSLTLRAMNEWREVQHPERRPREQRPPE